eukprot:CAMPEP_0169463748 /NCGR_PEP_ID=MMETSP1042-20121227/20279_1 /TAXON_ID=464988 /ORGANISM="Hemiselmis andersenii, Strain CCMP1180" /LENGTH=252 /DNA_ID=CAMNT_0009576513 /DNA_START=154 /DNA_END=914 /DNA_ORIENTATION=+
MLLPLTHVRARPNGLVPGRCLRLAEPLIAKVTLIVGFSAFAVTLQGGRELLGAYETPRGGLAAQKVDLPSQLNPVPLFEEGLQTSKSLPLSPAMSASAQFLSSIIEKSKEYTAEEEEEEPLRAPCMMKLEDEVAGSLKMSATSRLEEEDVKEHSLKDTPPSTENLTSEVGTLFRAERIRVPWSPTSYWLLPSPTTAHDSPPSLDTKVESSPSQSGGARPRSRRQASLRLLSPTTEQVPTSSQPHGAGAPPTL